LSNSFFNKFFKNDPIENLWKMISSIINIDLKNIIFFENKVGIMCWEKNYQIKMFCNEKLKNILNDGVENSETNFELIDEKGEVFWIILNDKNFNELVSSAFTVMNALHQEISQDSVMGLIFPLEIDKNLNLTYQDKSLNNYLVFNETPPGYYPLIYQNGTRQPISELELYDEIKNTGIFINSNQAKWFSVDEIPF